MATLPYIIAYDPAFLGDGFQVPYPGPACHGQLLESGRVFDYLHYSLVMHRNRRTALFTAHNLDMSRKRAVVRRDHWSLDTRIGAAFQTGPAAYANNPWDRGHLVRRDDVAWGSAQEAQDASDATFFFSNAAPQHERFNQDEWLNLEDWVQQKAGAASERLCVFCGPLYTHHDLFVGDVRIPSAFWKIVVLRDPTAPDDDLSALGFVMKQNELWDDWNGAATDDLHLYQVGITEIGGYTGLGFGELAVLDEFEWRQARFRDRTRMRPIEITGPDDLRFFGDRRRARGIRALRVGRGGGASGADGVAGGERTPARSGARSGRAGGCGCRDGVDRAADERVAVLARQVDALRDVVDTLLEDQPATRDADLARARALAREAYTRIVGGQTTASGEFPECACIGGDAGSGDWFCSGVLVHPRVVVTAAHCAESIRRVYLDGRSINLVGAVGEVVPVERVFVHPDYDDTRVPSHDIAVVLLAHAAQTAPVGVAAQSEVDAEDNVTLVGFGYEHPTENVGFGTKRKVDVPLTGTTGLTPAEITALEQLHGFDARYEVHAGRKMLGKDSCNGDSGGPAYIVGAQMGRKVAAVTSRAAFSSELRCGDGGLYTRIAPYQAWIHAVTGGLVDNGAGQPAEPGSPPTPPPSPPSAAAPAGPYISAAQPNPAGADAGREWVELTNSGSADLSLEGYAIADRQGGRLPLSGALSAGATRRFDVPADAAVALGNAGDDIVLLRDGVEFQRVTYAGAASGAVLRFEPPAASGTGAGDTPAAAPLIGADPC